MPRPRDRAVLAAALIFCFCAPAAQGAGWVTGPPVSPANRISTEPDVAVTPGGGRIASWIQYAADGSTTEGLGVRSAPTAGGAFGAPQVFPGSAYYSSLAVGGDGTAVLLWAQVDGVHIARRAPGEATFTAATPLALGAGEYVRGAPRVAVAGGDAFVVFTTEKNVAGTRISTARAARLAAGATALLTVNGPGPGGTLDQVSYADATPEHILGDPTVAADGTTVVAGWEELLGSNSGTGPSTTTIKYATRTAADFGPATTADTRSWANFRADSVDPAVTSGGGRTYLAWVRAIDQIAFRDLADPGVTRTVPVVNYAFPLRAQGDSGGGLVLGWGGFEPATTARWVFGATAAPGADATPRQQLTAPGASRAIDDLATGRDGSALVLVERYTSSLSGASVDVESAFRPPGGTFGVLEDVSGARERVGPRSLDPAATAVDAGGAAVAAWTADDNSGSANQRVYVSERDAAPPVLTSVTVPAGAATGARIDMAATATDALSGATIEWDFGDGSNAAGTAVNHAYGTAGSYTVTVTARDGAGNASSQTRTIVITGPSGGGGAGPDPDTTPPVVSALRSANKRFRVGAGATALIAAAKAKAGTTFRMSISERATLVIRITGKLPGHRRGKRCVSGGTRGRRCTIAVAPGTLIRAGRGGGAVNIPFSGRIERTRLRAGAYRATVTAIDAAGNRSRPVSIPFTIVTR